MSATSEAYAAAFAALDPNGQWGHGEREATARRELLRQEAGEFWPWPWRKPRSHYDSDGPEVAMEVAIKGIPLRFRVSPTIYEGCDTGRTRFKVECLTCEVVLHPRTTGTTDRLIGHVEHDHGLLWGPMAVLFERCVVPGYAVVRGGSPHPIGPLDCWRVTALAGSRSVVHLEACDRRSLWETFNEAVTLLVKPDKIKLELSADERKLCRRG